MKDRKTQILQFLKESPLDPFLKYALAMEFIKENDLNSAKQSFENLVDEHPDYLGTYYHFGKLLEKLNENVRALEIYEKGMHVAKASKDRHALSELQGAFNLASNQDDEEW